MKKKLMTKRAITEKFMNEKLDGKMMNYLVGGDGDGGQGAPPDPWV